MENANASARFNKPRPPKPGVSDATPTAQRGMLSPYEAMVNDPQWLIKVQSTLRPCEVNVQTSPNAAHDDLARISLQVYVPDDWPHITLAPLYDVHFGSAEHDKKLFEKHLKWIVKTPHVLTWNGGDFIENANKLSPGSGVYAQQSSPQEQIFDAIQKQAVMRHKMLFSLAGNHEDRLEQLGMDVSQWLAQTMGIPYFPGYCACRISWRGNVFTLLAHHGSGWAQTPGAQLTNIRKELPWASNFDLYWFGHLHQEISKKEPRVVFDPRTGELVHRDAYVIMSPSYLKYFGGSYAEKKRLPPSIRGMVTVVLQADGRMDLTEHAGGVRF